MTIRLQKKVPAEATTYLHDWSTFLGSDTIAGQVTTGVGVTVSSGSIITGNQAIQFSVSGGTLGTVGRITQTITSAGGLIETEYFTVPIEADEPISLAEAKRYLRFLSTDSDEEDAKIEDMIPRAREWVENETGLLLIQRSFVERLSPVFGAIRLTYGPLVTVDDVSYVDELGADQTYVPRYWPGQEMIFPVSGESWPTVTDGDAFEITYTAGVDPVGVNERLRGAMFALIEGEFSDGYAWPDRALKAAAGACAQLRQMVA